MALRHRLANVLKLVASEFRCPLSRVFKQTNKWGPTEFAGILSNVSTNWKIFVGVSTVDGFFMQACFHLQSQKTQGFLSQNLQKI